jgi:hypothetical protein
MPSVSDSHREVAHERATARALRSLNDRVLTECVLTNSGAFAVLEVSSSVEVSP